MVPQDLTNWKAPHVTDPASTVRSHASIALRSVSHRLVEEFVFLFFFPPPPPPFSPSLRSSSTCSLIHIIPYLFSSVLLSPSSSPFSREALTTQSRFASYFHKPLKASHSRVFYSGATHKLCHSQRRGHNTPAHKHTNTHKQAGFLFSLNLHKNLNLRELIWFTAQIYLVYHLQTSQAASKAKNGILLKAMKGTIHSIQFIRSQMYECGAAKNKSTFIYLYIFSDTPLPPPRLHSHSLRPKSFSSGFCSALRGDGLKIEVFPRHVLELFPSVSNPPSLSLLLTCTLHSLAARYHTCTHTRTHTWIESIRFTIC